MKSLLKVVGLLSCAGVAWGQFGSLNWGSPSNIGPPGRPQYGKPPRPFSGGGGGGGGGGGSYPPPGGPSGAGGPPRGDYNEDPIPPMADADSSYDTQQLPAKLPILAPNGVVEIYNRVVDDLIRKLEGDLVKKELDPMMVVIRPTPPGPVRVPGYLQKRPFRRPGAALYRSTAPVQPPSGPILNLKKDSSTPHRRGKAGVLPPETRFGDRPVVVGVGVDVDVDDEENVSFRGAGKISKATPVVEAVDDDEKEILETTASTTTTTSTTTTEAPKEAALPPLPISSEERPSSEEDAFMKPRSEEFFPEPEDEDDAPKAKKEKKRDESEEVEEEKESAKVGGSQEKDVDSLIQHYQSKNSKAKDKYSGKKKNSKPVVSDPIDELEEDAPTSREKNDSPPPFKKVEKDRKNVKDKKKKDKESEESEDDDDEDDEPEQRDDNNDEEFDGPPEAGTGGGKRPNGGYYPPGGPPAVPAKPNAELSGLSRIRRASDVSVSVDARSAVITARLLVGPINVVINDSIEPMEKNVKATIPELEAELLLMERHGVVFLQRFTLDRAYGQDVEISIPKSKDKKKNAKNNPQTTDPNHPMNVESRRQTKMAAHISMEVVKLLRSGNLRVNLMRTAQGAMSKLKLPIKKAKNKKKAKKDKNKKHD